MSLIESQERAIVQEKGGTIGVSRKKDPDCIGKTGCLGRLP